MAESEGPGRFRTRPTRFRTSSSTCRTAPLAAVPQGYAAGRARQCGADVSGAARLDVHELRRHVHADERSDADGRADPDRHPARPLAAQSFTIDTPPACQTTAIGALNLPANKTDGLAPVGGIASTNIPLTAISTGDVDALECVLLKMGVDQTEFTSDTANRRSHPYLSTRQRRPVRRDGALRTSGTAMRAPLAQTSALMATGGTYMGYDQIMLPCWGAARQVKDTTTRDLDELGELITYADSGGHFFATHYSYSWLVNNGEFNNVANWNPDTTTPARDVGAQRQRDAACRSRAAALGHLLQWLNLSPRSRTHRRIPPSAERAHRSTSATAARRRRRRQRLCRLDRRRRTRKQERHAGGALHVQHTRRRQTSQCGHAIFSDFHVTNAKNTGGKTSPATCDGYGTTR